MFDVEMFLSDFSRVLESEANRISKIQLEKLKSARFGNNRSDLITGFENSYRKVIGKVSSENVFKIVFGTKAIKAFISEFGSGSKMVGANENPFLSDYLNSEGYNPTRSRNASGGNVVRSWGNRKYKTFDWNTDSGRSYIERQGSRNIPAGTDIETGTETGQGFFGGKYTPRKPNFMLRKVVIECQRELYESIKIEFERMINDDSYYYGFCRRIFAIHINWEDYNV